MNLIHPTYFPNVALFSILCNREYIFENEDNYQKQTYRNRAYIYGPNGGQTLIVPISHSPNTFRKKYRDVRIDYSSDWRINHLKTIENSYRSSAFYEFFEDKIRSFFDEKFKYLIELNFASIKLLSECLQLQITYQKTESYQPSVANDYRFLVEAKSRRNFHLETYYQLFADKHGFIENLSILDLLFNEGLQTVEYLKRQIIDI